MSRSWKILICLNTGLLILGFGLIFWLESRANKEQESICERLIELSAIYSSHQFWAKAVDALKKASQLCPKEKSILLSLRAGDICSDKLSDQQCVVDSYFYAQALGKDFSTDPERASKLVKALKELGKEKEAKALLDDLTALVPTEESGSTVIALIGERRLTLAQLKKELELEPKEVQKSFQGSDGLKRYFEQWLFTKLLARSALKEGLLDEKAKKMLERQKEKFLAQLYFNKKIAKQVKINASELKNYYEKHKSEFKNASGEILGFEQAKPEIEKTLRKEKINQLAKEWLQNQLEKNNIKIYEKAFKNSD